MDFLCENHQMAIRNTFLITLVVHLAEAVVAMMLCAYMDYENTTMFKWGLSVFVHGVFSLKHLLSELFRYVYVGSLIEKNNRYSFHWTGF